MAGMGSKKHNMFGGDAVRTVIIAVIAAAAAIVVFLFFRPPGESDALPFAAILPLSGAVGYQTCLADAMRLAVEEVNEHGGIQGKRIRLTIADSASDPKTAVKEFHRLLDTEQPVLFFSSLSSISAALAPLAEENEVPLLALVTTSPSPVKGRKWVYKFFNNPGSGIPILLDVLGEQKVKTLGILSQDDDFGVSYANSLTQAFEEMGGKIVRLQFPTGKTETLPDLTPLMDTEAVCVVAFSGSLPALYTTLRESGYSKQLLASNSGALPSAWQNKDAEGVFVPAPYFYNERFMPGHRFKEKYRKRYGLEPDHNDATAYDIIYILKGLLRTGALSRAGIRESLGSGFSFTGAVGEVDISPGRHVFDFPLAKAQVNDGKLEFKRWRE